MLILSALENDGKRFSLTEQGFVLLKLASSVYFRGTEALKCLTKSDTSSVEDSLDRFVGSAVDAFVFLHLGPGGREGVIEGDRENCLVEVIEDVFDRDEGR